MKKALLIAIALLVTAAPAAPAEPPLPESGPYSSHLHSRDYLRMIGWTVHWTVHGVYDGAPVSDVKECPDHPRPHFPTCLKHGNDGYLWEDKSSLVWHVRLKFPDSNDFQVDGHWNRHGGGIMCYLHGNGEREHTHLFCSPPFGFTH
jgi:hypothetical protein